MRKKRQVLAAYPTNVDAVVLALDTSKTSTGAALLYPKHVNAAGELDPRGAFAGVHRVVHPDVVNTFTARSTYVTLARQAAQAMQVPWLVVAETWTPHGKWGFDATLGMGESWGWWSGLFVDELHPSQILRLEPNAWRDVFFGRKRPHTREELKALACAYVHARFRFETGDDVAEAICLGLCGVQLELAHSAVEKWHRRQKKP